MKVHGSSDVGGLSVKTVLAMSLLSALVLTALFAATSSERPPHAPTKHSGTGTWGQPS